MPPVRLGRSGRPNHEVRAVYQDVTNQTLESTTKRAVSFLRAIATKAEIRNVMASAGYDAAEQKEGWRLVTLVSGLSEPKVVREHDDKARATIAELDALDEPLFRRAHAALGRLHPEQDAFVFSGLAPARGPEAVVAVATFLDRLDALESAQDRRATRKADQGALATLEKRGITAEYREQLRELVAVAQAVEFPDEPPTDAVTTSEREEALIELRAWYKDWAETARSLIVRRDHLILMGLARRRQSLRGEAEESEGAVDDDGAENGGGAGTSSAGLGGASSAGLGGASSAGLGGASSAGLGAGTNLAGGAGSSVLGATGATALAHPGAAPAAGMSNRVGAGTSNRVE